MAWLIVTMTKTLRSLILIICATLFVPTLIHAHVIGNADSRINIFFASENYYFNTEQAKLAYDSIGHLNCKKNDGTWDQNSTSTFLIDVDNYIQDYELSANAEVCRSKIVISVAHYPLSRDASKCSVFQNFLPKQELNQVKGKSHYSDVENIVFGSMISSEYSAADPEFELDYSILKINNLMNFNPKDNEYNYGGLKICPNNIINSNYSLSDKNILILPHLSPDKRDLNAESWGLHYAEKTTSGRCKFEGVDSRTNLMIHTCDMAGRASGSPLLMIRNNDMCVMGVQKGHEISGKKQNYALSTQGSKFTSQLSGFIEQNCKF